MLSFVSDSGTGVEEEMVKTLISYKIIFSIKNLFKGQEPHL